MRYLDFVNVYEEISSTTKILEKVSILKKFLPKIKGNEQWIYLLRGRVFPDYDEREFGISTQLCMKAISKSSGVSLDKVSKEFNKIGDLGDIAQKLIDKKRQSNLFSKRLDVKDVFDNLVKVVSLVGKGSVDKKMDCITELMTSSSGLEAKYIIRTLLNDLRIGVADAIVRDSISDTFLSNSSDNRALVEGAYDRINDWAFILKLAEKGVKALKNVKVVPGKPMKVMLPVKVTDLDEGFRICGTPLAVEHKYDGFRVLINKEENGNVTLFTRRLDSVTNQFPDVIKTVLSHVKAKSFVLDSEVVGYDSKTKKYTPFEAISQRIRRKHNIDKLMKSLPVEINVFDIMYYDGESTIDLPFNKRRKLIEKIVKTENLKIKLAKQFVTDSKKKVQEFYMDALKYGEEGIMMKKIDAPYRPGRRVGYMVKMKPDAKDLDLVITGAEYGTGKRAGGLTSFYVACADGKDKDKNTIFLEVGKVSSGLKEKASEGVTYSELDKILQPLIISEKGKYVKLKPKVVVSVTYQNVQPSTRYDSGFALRFPRITHYRPERGIYDIASLKDIKKESKSIFNK